MSKFFLRLFLLLLITFISVLIYLSYFGIKTEKFDNLIKDKANKVNQNVKLEFKKTKIKLNLNELNLVVRLQNPKILIRSNEINLSKLDLFLPIRSFFTSDFLLKRAEIAFIENNIRDLTKITNIVLPKFINNKLKKKFAEGKITGEFVIPFLPNGSIGKDYEFSGKVSDTSINFTEDFSVKNLTTEINHVRDKDDDGGVFKATIIKGSIYDLELADSTIYLKRKKKTTKVESLLRTNGKLNFSQIKKISSLFSLNTGNLIDINGDVDLKTNISFDLNKKLRVKNLSYAMEGDISYFEIHTKERKIIKKYLPEYDPKIVFKDSNIKLIKHEPNYITELNGFIKAKDNFDNFKFEQIYNYDKKSFDINGIINLTNSKVKVERLNYIKDYGKTSKVSFDFNFVSNKYYNIKSLNFLADKTKIYLSDIKLNNNFEIKDFKKLEIRTFENEVKNNDFIVKKTEKITILGEVFDAKPLLKSLYKKSDKKTFNKDFNSEIKININKVLTGTNDDVSDLSMIASINKGSYDKLNLKGNFSENEIVEMSIYQIDKDKKTLQVISDRARPFVKNFNFIKGFEGGKLEYESIISKKVANSNLKLTDFKVSKVPALAKLLTLASLQGIADTLSGEGIRFDSFEMKSNSVDNLLNIEDALAIGPAVSILLVGYVDKGKIVSLRGTLVPATKLNSIIASIPLVGDILVGKKTGEGVVGVSFKMKGPPKDIKTTVNPIKTLTPRFIVRAIEKMKKEKKE